MKPSSFLYSIVHRLRDVRLFGLPLAYHYPSPSKIYLLHRLRRFARAGGAHGTTLDVASADLKYRELFDTELYAGVDYQQALIERGLTRHAADPRVAGFAGDARGLAEAPGVADLVVSTHTIAHFPAAEWNGFVTVLADCVTPGGRLFFNLPSTADQGALSQLLTTRFRTVTVTRYGTRYGMAIEGYFNLRTAGQGNLRMLVMAAAASLSLLLAPFERLLGARGAYLVYECTGRRGGQAGEVLARLSSIPSLRRIVHRAGA